MLPFFELLIVEENLCGRVRDMLELSLLLAQFSCEPKIALRKF
jgi:hypothetical protein